MTHKNTLFAAVGLLAGIIASGLFLAYQAHAGITYTAPVLQNSLVNHTFFSATTTNATSTSAQEPGDRVLRLDGADKLTFHFSRADNGAGNTGTSRFEVEVSPDGSSWYDFSRLHLADASKSATSSVSISAATSTTLASMDIEHNAFRFARCLVVETTDGEHSCSASVQY